MYRKLNGRREQIINNGSAPGTVFRKHAARWRLLMNQLASDQYTLVFIRV